MHTHTSTSHLTELRTVAVPVTDQDVARSFYVEQLGLELRMDEPVEQIGGRWIEVVPPGATTSIALMPAGDAPVGGPTGIRLSTGDAAAAHEALRELGVAVGELLQWPGVPPMFTLTDPDGNELVVVQ